MQEEQYIHIDKNGNKRYYKDREMTIAHRTDGPAVEWPDGHKQWWVDEKLHRLDGPAVEYANGEKEWYVNDKELSEKQFNALSAPTLELTLDEIAAKFGIDVSKLKIVK